jgi:hypothetical protein
MHCGQGRDKLFSIIRPERRCDFGQGCHSIELCLKDRVHGLDHLGADGVPGLYLLHLLPNHASSCTTSVNGDTFPWAICLALLDRDVGRTVTAPVHSLHIFNFIFKTN